MQYRHDRVSGPHPRQKESQSHTSSDFSLLAFVVGDLPSVLLDDGSAGFESNVGAGTLGVPGSTTAGIPISASCLLQILMDLRSGRLILIRFAAAASAASTDSASSPNDNKPVFLEGRWPVSHEIFYIQSARSITYFFAFRLCSLRSASRWASRRASCCALRSAAVIRGTISVNGFSMIRMPMILGGLDGFSLSMGFDLR